MTGSAIKGDCEDDEILVVTVGSVGHMVPQLQTSWTRAEAACAARRRGDKNAELEAEKPQNLSAPDEKTPLEPGFTLYL